MGGLCCCSHSNEPTFPRKEGMSMPRTITDKCGMVTFYAFVAGMVACILSGIWYGNPKRLTHGSDWEGNICGIDTPVIDQKFMIFCGSPERVGEFPKFILQGSTACVKSCPTDTTMSFNCLMPAFHNFTSYKGGVIGAIENVETLEMTLTQSVTLQKSYPTEPWGGRFCLPSQSKNPALRDLIINGPWGHFYRPQVAIGGTIDAWPLFVGSALVACLLGWIFMHCMSTCAGMVIFGSMAFSTILALSVGLFFFFAVFFNMDDANSDYASLNPITSVFIGEEAKIYSIITGVILILLSVCLGITTATSMSHIDEMIGLIDAATSCIDKSCQFKLLPVFQGGSFLAIVVFFVFYGLPMVASLGVLGNAEIAVNGEGIQGLRKVWKKNWIQSAQFWYYIVGVWWILEFYIQFGHYVVSYAVTSWYFNGGTTKAVAPATGIEKAMGGIGKTVPVRVAGIDANYGERYGVVTDYGNGGKVLVIPVQKRGPGLDRAIMPTEEFVKSAMPCMAISSGCISAFFFHIGSIAVGAPVIAILRPFRLASQGVAAILARASPDASKDAHNQNVKGCIGLFTTCLEQVFGKYSKTAYSELVLSGQDDFFTCADNSFTFLVRSGGSLAYLHGAMFMYEIVGTLMIMLFNGWLVLILQAEIKDFNEVGGPYYIEDKNSTLIISVIISGAVAWGWMSLWTQTADVLLYCVAWNRHQVFLGHEMGLDHAKVLGGVNEYCPSAIRYLLPAYELDPHYEHGLHAHGMGQQGAIIAAMEHGAMNHSAPAGGKSSAPQYSQMVSGIYNTGVKIAS